MPLNFRKDIHKHWIRYVQNIWTLCALGDKILLCVSRASSKESWRTLLIPEWSVDDVERQNEHIQTLGKLCARFKVFRCTGWMNELANKNQRYHTLQLKNKHETASVSCRAIFWYKTYFWLFYWLHHLWLQRMCSDLTQPWWPFWLFFTKKKEFHHLKKICW